jgi:uncharacterized protein DUF4126
MAMTPFDLAVSIALGIGLAAATGFRVFLPLLITSIATYGGYIPVSEGFSWIGTPAAVIMLGVAALAEVLAYYIPGVDNLLDTIATPAALIAGTLVSAAVMADLPPLIKWTAAVIAGGGAAGITQGVTTLIRANSTVFTGGLGNPVIATGELGGATIISLLALSVPFVAVGLVALFCWFAIRTIRRLLRRAPKPETQGTG